MAVNYAERLEAFRKSDTERDALVAQVLADYEELKSKVDEITDDYRNEKQVASSSDFAVVLIDGDGAIFSDYLYGMGRDGGAEVAHQLHTEVQRHLKAIYPDSNVDDWNIVVQVVLNLGGLATKLQGCGIVMNSNEVLAFARSFGLAQLIFSFIDVGGGKERADHKLREHLRLYLRIAQCKHVFFAPCHDNGYLPVLESYRREHGSRITLIETRPAEPGFVEVGLSRIQMPRIFRSDNLPGGPVKAMPNVMLDTATNLISAPLGSSWATVGKNGASTKTISIAPKKTATRKFILVNTYDERIDIELPRTDPAAETRFVKRAETFGKLCNSYHLMGRCERGEYCDYYHGEKVAGGEKLVLMHKARSLSCPSKYTCREAICPYGHHCKFGKMCYLDRCFFADTHSMDLEAAKKVYEDGSEEWLPAYLEKAR
ncbi:Putative Zinc finger, CCCH-type [Septoria linicola]|uniref:Zinc finger, CCCH-type n=1 Tax=Septoria linicola TaxID=215465 RepID=A0A9Q9EGD1_9PEZI|nr:Putative Zinc finger, CCCH-type [Septoria linicola]